MGWRKDALSPAKLAVVVACRCDGAYLAHRACGERKEERAPHFPSMMRLLGLYCSGHGWRPAPHLRQAPLF